MNDGAVERDVLIVSCAVSAGIHAALVPAHAAEGAAAAAAFAASSAALAALAVALTLRPSARLVAAAGAALAGLLVAYVAATTAGIPLLHDRPEPLGGLGLLTKAVEVSGLAAAVHMLRPRGVTA